MARIRSIKPEFPQSETIGKLSRDARLLFVQLWTIVDDAGRARAASRMLASLLYPYDNDAPTLIETWLAELEAHGCVRRYEVDGSSFLDLPNWLKHQKIDRPSASKIPAFVEGSTHPREPSRAFDADLGSRTMDQDLGDIPKADAFESDPPAAPAVPAFDDLPPPSPTSVPADLSDDGGDPRGSLEDQYWHRVGTTVTATRVARSRFGQLANLLNGDFERGLVIIDAVAKAKTPSAYLGAIIRDMTAEASGAAPPKRAKGEPEWVARRRAEGAFVEREGPNRWRDCGILHDDEGREVGW